MFVISIVILSILIQVMAAFMALRLIKVTGNQWSWAFIAAAMVLQAVRRILILIELINGQLAASEAQTSEVLGLLLSVLMFAGVASIGSFFAAQARSIAEHRREEEKLSEASKYTRSLIEASLDPFVTINDKGKINDVNRATEEATGFSRRELISSDFSNYFTDPEKAGNGYKKVLSEGQVVDYHLTLKHKSGSLRDVLYNAVIYKDEKGEVRGVFATARDITERKKAEEELKELSRRLIDAQSIAKVGSWETNLLNLNIKWSEETFRIFEVDPDNFKTTHPNFLQFVHPEDRAKVEGAFKDSFTTHARNTIQHRIITPGGKLKFVEENWRVFYNDKGQAVRALGTCSDITERKRIENALRDSEEKYRTLFNNSSDAIMLLDENGFFDCNDAILRVFGFSRKEDFISVQPWQISPPHQPDGMDSKKAAGNKITEAYKTGINHFEWVHRRQNGEDFFADVLLTALNLKGKQVLLATVRDISERKQAEKDLRQTVQKLKELDKLKDNFLNNTTHELKTPLVPIKSQLQLLLAGDYGVFNEKQKEALEMILKNEEILNKLANEILDVARIKSDKLDLCLEKASLEEMIVDVVKDKENLVQEKQITLSLLPVPELPQRSIDKRRIAQVLNNLLDNAIKFTLKGGSISINVRKNENDVVVTIEDTGIGLSKENIEKIFIPFFQVQSNLVRKYRGAGLGLAICKGIVEAHGGRIWAESGGEGKGSSFSFSLPAIANNNNKNSQCVN